MAIMDRLTRLIRAHLNHALDRAEDPELILEQILRDMQANLSAARTQTRDMIAQEHALDADLAQARRLTETWTRRAEAAATAGQDDLARAALRHKRDSAANEAIYEQQLAAQRETVARLKSRLQQLESRYQTALGQKDALIARQRRAKSIGTIQSYLDDSTRTELTRIERVIRRNEATAAAQGELAEMSMDNQFRALDDPLIDADLLALKQRLAQETIEPDLALNELDALDAVPQPRAIRSGLP
jgi:phage shock protein A